MTILKEKQLLDFEFFFLFSKTDGDKTIKVIQDLINGGYLKREVYYRNINDVCFTEKKESVKKEEIDEQIFYRVIKELVMFR